MRLLGPGVPEIGVQLVGRLVDTIILQYPRHEDTRVGCDQEHELLEYSLYNSFLKSEHAHAQMPHNLWAFTFDNTFGRPGVDAHSRSNRVAYILRHRLNTQCLKAAPALLYATRFRHSSWPPNFVCSSKSWCDDSQASLRHPSSFPDVSKTRSNSDLRYKDLLPLSPIDPPDRTGGGINERTWQPGRCSAVPLRPFRHILLFQANMPQTC